MIYIGNNVFDGAWIRHEPKGPRSHFRIGRWHYFPNLHIGGGNVMPLCGQTSYDRLRPGLYEFSMVMGVFEPVEDGGWIAPPDYGEVCKVCKSMGRDRV